MGSWDSGTWDSSIWDVTEGESGLYYYPRLWPHYRKKFPKKIPKLDSVQPPADVEWKTPVVDNSFEARLKRLDKDVPKSKKER